MGNFFKKFRDNAREFHFGGEIHYAEKKGWLPKGTIRYIHDQGWVTDRFRPPTLRMDWGRFQFANENEESAASRQNNKSFTILTGGEYDFRGDDEIAVLFLGHHYYSCLEWVIFEVQSTPYGNRDHEWKVSIVPFMDFGQRDQVDKLAYAQVTADRDRGPGKSDFALYVTDPTGVFAVVDAGPGKAVGHAFVTTVFSTTSEDLGAFERGIAAGVLVGSEQQELPNKEIG